MKVGIIQMAVSADKQTNLDRASQHIRDAAGRGADLVILGEMFCCPYENAAFTANAETREGPSTACLSRAARENGVYLVGGSIPLLEDVLELPHLERERFCREISRINREANSQEKNVFDA